MDGMDVVLGRWPERIGDRWATSGYFGPYGRNAGAEDGHRRGAALIREGRIVIESARGEECQEQWGCKERGGDAAVDWHSYETLT